MAVVAQSNAKMTQGTSNPTADGTGVDSTTFVLTLAGSETVARGTISITIPGDVPWAFGSEYVIQVSTP